MKKIIIFITLFLFPIFANAEEITKFSLSEVTASPGNTITINLNMDNKQSFGVLTAKIHYDNTKIKYISSEIKGLKNSALNGVEKSEDKSLLALYAINLSNNNLMHDNGTILTIEFEIAEDATEDIPITLEIKDFGLIDSTTFNYEVTNGIIHLKNNIETVSKDDKKSLLDDIKEELDELEINQTDVTITSTNEEIATVDESGNIEFKSDGNVDIVVKDNEGNVIYTKGYFVKNDLKKTPKILIPIIIFIILILLIIIIRRKKCQKKAQK